MIQKVISGGQTGIDTLALQLAHALQIPTGGTAPKGFITEYGPDPTLTHFGLVEHESPFCPPRTEKNVIDSDATLWIGNPTSKGAQLTLRSCQLHGKLCIHNPTKEQFIEWVDANQIKILNIAGNRGSSMTEMKRNYYRNYIWDLLTVIK